MFDLLNLACEAARRHGCEFADARYLDIRRQRVSSRDLALSGCNDSDDRGFGVRVLYRGAWGFASSPIYSSPGSWACTSFTRSNAWSAWRSR